MPTDFTFTLSVSDQRFRGKPSKTEMSRITFHPRRVSSSTLLDLAYEGRVFCPTFKSSKPNGEFDISAKTSANFESSSVIFYDFDDMTVPMRDFIGSLTYKPSFGYPTYSNGLGDKYRFRLGYVFDHPIVGGREFRSIYDAIAKANRFPKETTDAGGLDVRNEIQCYFGTRSTEDPYLSYMRYGAYEFDKYRTTTSDTSTRTSTPTYVTNTSITIDESFLNDLNTLGTETFFKKYYDVYGRNYWASLSSRLVLDDSQMFFTYPDDYVAVTHKRRGKMTLKWDIGEGRKNKLFFTAQIMLFNEPTLTIENLLYNLRLERDWYYENSDGKVNNQYLIKAGCKSMVKRYPLHPSKHPSFTVNKQFWIEQGVSMQQAKNYVRAYLNVQRVRKFFNPFLSIKKNHELLKENGVKVSLRTLQRMVTRGDIQINQRAAVHTDLSDRRKDVTNPVTNAILNLIRADGTIKQSTLAEMLELDIRTVKRYFKDMSGKFIKREGNNRTGRWVVIEVVSGCDQQE